MGSILAWVRKIPLEEGMATHSSILAWRTSCTEEAGYSPWGCTELDTTEATSYASMLISWRRKWQPTPEFLPGKFHG